MKLIVPHDNLIKFINNSCADLELVWLPISTLINIQITKFKVIIVIDMVVFI